MSNFSLLQHIYWQFTYNLNRNTEQCLHELTYRTVMDCMKTSNPEEYRRGMLRTLKYVSVFLSKMLSKLYPFHKDYNFMRILNRQIYNKWRYDCVDVYRALDNVDIVICPKYLIRYTRDHVNVKMYRKIFKEALDASLLLCNKFDQFSISMILYYMEQILPTAMVLGTSYWPFYQVTGQCLCICRQYDRTCKHALICEQFIDLDCFTDFEENDALIYSSSNNITMALEDFHVEITKPSNCTFILTKVRFNLINYQGNKAFNTINCNLLLECDVEHEQKRPVMSVKLEPHPKHLHYYGRYVKLAKAKAKEEALTLSIEERPFLTLFPSVAMMSALNAKERKSGNYHIPVEGNALVRSQRLQIERELEAEYRYMHLKRRYEQCQM